MRLTIGAWPASLQSMAVNTSRLLGSEHGDFNDTVYLRRRALLLGPKNNGAAIRTAADYSAAFFGQVLNGEASPLFSNPPADVRLRNWDRPSPKESAK